MDVLITFTTIGTDAGPFNLYSNANGYCCAFAVGVTRAELLAGFAASGVPNTTTIIRAKSVGVCTNYYDIVVPPQLCFKFLPADTSYTLSQVYNPTNSYIYGFFTGYEESGVVTTSHDLVKLNIDLTVDDSFYVGTGFNEILYSGSSILQQPDGKIIATGTFVTYQGVSANRIIRLNADGTRDTGFVIGTGFDDYTQKPAIDSLGNIIVPGRFFSYNGASSPRIVRLLPNGTRDTTFVVGTGFNNVCLSVLANPDNSVLVTGYFNTYKGAACGNGITKLNSVGTVDPSFVVGTGFSPFAPNNANYMTRLDGETSFYVSGYFTSYKGVAEPRIIKLDMLGNKDVSFNAGTGFNAATFSISTAWGNKLFIEGFFTTYNGTPANSFIILNADGTIHYTPGAVFYNTPIIIGDNLFGQQTGGCLELLFTHVPATTTTTSTTPPTTTTSTTACNSYRYTSSIFVCSTCGGAGGQQINNATPLTVGKYYYNPSVGFVSLITSFLGCFPNAPTESILDASQQNSCAAVICPTTTTTTTL